MAFNFNWSPLTADADFYRRARDLLTAALNKSPKPPIIVDDILVTEFNLGSVPPDLEILEIGDLAEDRFRGIFKMCYSGDAFLTLKTRVQANPLNTYLYSKPSFTSPQPLAAASGLTIPLSITLSEIKLSAFIILVFSKQKGLTLVFRNDPLESLKVSSTFDSIQFVRDYLQRTIENQLRTLMMDELPAIIHRLSLQLWCPDQVIKPDDDQTDDLVADPLSSSPMDLVEGNPLLDSVDASSLSLDDGADLQSVFSLRNLLKLKSLKDSPTSLDLLSPSVKDFICRIWSGPFEGSSSHNSPPTATPTLTKSNSFHGSATTYTFSDSGSAAPGHLPSRPSLVSLHSATTGLSLGSGTRSRSYQGRKKKNRVVNLRKARSDYSGSEASQASSAATSETGSVAGDASEPLIASSIPEEPEDELVLPAVSSPSKVRFDRTTERAKHAARPPLMADLYTAPEAAAELIIAEPARESKPVAPLTQVPSSAKMAAEKMQPPAAVSESGSVILEQAWIMKMAGEIARRVYEEKNRQRGGMWEEQEDAPPAYSATR